MYIVIVDNKKVITCQTYKQAYYTRIWFRSVANRRNVIIVKDGKVVKE